MRSALGKGLNALISDDMVASVSSAAPVVQTAPAAASTLPIDKIHPNPKQPRRRFAEAALSDLVSSIKEKGVLQPILVSPVEGGTFEIVAGERRWRAAQRAGLTEIPAVIKSGTEIERFEMALVENLQREDLNPIELAEGFKRLHDEFQLTQEAIAKVVGKDRAVVANTLRFLGLSDEIQNALREGSITAGHAKALLAIEDVTAQKTLFSQIVAGRLTVRHVEHAARAHKKGKTDDRPAEVRAIEEELQHALSRKVDIQMSSASSQKGSVKLEFYSLDDFEQLIITLKKTALQNG